MTCFLQVAGPDATSLLHNLVTNEVRTLQPGAAVYAHFLNSGGKMQFEALLALAAVGASGPEWLLDVATADQPQLMRTLSLYKLRSKVRVQASPLLARVVLGPPRTLSAVLAAPPPPGACVFADARLAQLGVRALLPPGAAWPPPELQLPELPERLLRVYRLLRGVAEAPELPANSVSLEMNLELLNGVSFSKGCYIGQELMARTHHTGVIRKRVLPCLVFNERCTPNWAALADQVRVHLAQPQTLLPPVVSDGQCETVAAGSELIAGGKAVGRVLACDAGVALVLLRLEALSGPPPRVEGAADLLAVPLMPAFFPRAADSIPKS